MVTLRLGGGAEFLGAFGPAGLEAGFGDAGVARDVGITDDEIIVGARFEEFLLHRFPGSFVEPQVDFGNLISDARGFGSQLEQRGFLMAEDRLAEQRDEETFA